MKVLGGYVGALNGNLYLYTPAALGDFSQPEPQAVFKCYTNGDIFSTGILFGSFDHAMIGTFANEK